MNLAIPLAKGPWRRRNPIGRTDDSWCIHYGICSLIECSMHQDRRFLSDQKPGIGSNYVYKKYYIYIYILYIIYIIYMYILYNI